MTLNTQQQGRTLSNEVQKIRITSNGGQTGQNAIDLQQDRMLSNAVQKIRMTSNTQHQGRTLSNEVKKIRITSNENNRIE